MHDIVEIAKQEIINRSNSFEQETKWTKDEYNIYNEHIQYVYKYVLLLSKNKKVDLEVLKLSALLHDISMTDRKLDRSKHNEYWAEIAEKLLKKNNYPPEKIKLVKRCILNHSSSRIKFRTTQEEKILVDADGLAHFDSIKSLYSLAHRVMWLNDKECIKFIQNKLTKDYNEISPEQKYLVDEKYKKIMSITKINELNDIISKTKYEYITQPDWIYMTDDEWNILAEITFEKVNDKTYDIDHTFVDESMRWQWIADELVEKAIDYIKAQWFSVTASCPFAKRWLKEHK